MDALRLSLEALELPNNSEIIVPANTFVGTALAAQAAGAIIVPAEIIENTGQIDHSKLDNYLTSKTKVIIPVHLYGFIGNMNYINKWAKKNKIIVLEDAAQAHGSMFNNIKAGNFGKVAAFSFYPTKNLGALGEGGAIVTNDLELAKRIKILRNYGLINKNLCLFSGSNSRLDEMQAAFLRIRLRELDNNNKRRVSVAHTINQLITNEFIKVLQEEEPVLSNYHLFPILTKYRDKFRNFLNKADINTQIHYSPPIHLHKPIRITNKKTLPISEKFCNNVLSLPCFPYMYDREIEYLTKIINRYKG